MANAAKEKVHNVVPELEALLVPIDSVQQHPDNARRGDVDFLMERLQEFGQYQVLVADEDGLLAVGNHRWQAAKKLGWTHVAAVRRPLDEDVARRLRLADNVSSDRAEWDQSRLLADLNEVATAAIDREGPTDEEDAQRATAEALASVGFDQLALDGLHRAVNGQDRGAPAAPPDGGFPDPEAGMTTEFACPNCRYEWSGNPKAGASAEPPAEA